MKREKEIGDGGPELPPETGTGTEQDGGDGLLTAGSGPTDFSSTLERCEKDVIISVTVRERSVTRLAQKYSIQRGHLRRSTPGRTARSSW